MIPDFKTENIQFLTALNQVVLQNIKKIFFRVINFIFGLKINFKNWKYLTCLTAFYQIVLQGIKNPLRKLIWSQKSIEFHLPHNEISQLSSH